MISDGSAKTTICSTTSGGISAKPTIVVYNKVLPVELYRCGNIQLEDSNRFETATVISEAISRLLRRFSSFSVRVVISFKFLSAFARGESVG
jgi:hypothetical protein